MPYFTLPYPSAPSVPSHLLEPMHRAKAHAALSSVCAEHPPRTLLSEVYDQEPAVAQALQQLIADFEYPDHSHKSLADLVKATAPNHTAHSFCWRYAGTNRWYPKTFEVACPLKAVELLKAHLARSCKGKPVVVDHMAFSSEPVGHDLFEAGGYSLLALDTPRPFALEYAGIDVVADAPLTPEGSVR